MKIMETNHCSVTVWSDLLEVLNSLFYVDNL